MMKTKQVPDPTCLTTKKLEHVRNLVLDEAVQLQSVITPRESQTDQVPLSFAQQRLWFLHQLQPEIAAYNISLAVRLTGLLNIPVLERSLNEIVKRHGTLRTTFAVVDGEPVQRIAPPSPFALSIVDLQTLPKAEREAEARKLITEVARRPFDLEHGPLLRSQLLKLDMQEHALVLVMHHAISDGWSVQIFWRELSKLYLSFSVDEPSTLADLPIQYADFAIWQRKWLEGEVQASQLLYWKRQLQGIQGGVELPTDYSRPSIQTFRGASQSITLPADQSEALRVLGRQEGCTLFMTLLAALSVLLNRYSGQDDIVVGSPIAGHNRAEIENLIGFFVNTLVLRTNLSGNPTFRALLRRVRETALGAFEHQDVPFERIVQELQPQRDLSRTPLFQVFLNVLNLEESALQLPGLEVTNLATEVVESKFDLTLYVRGPQREIYFKLVYNADLFKPARIAEMLEQFRELLLQVTREPDEKISRYSLLTQQTKALLPDPKRVLERSWETPIHSWFSQQARQDPKRQAVIDKHGSCNYEELEARSNQLAHYLLAQGVGREQVVAIYGHRCRSLALAILGIVKAGAAFLILDAAYPAPRLIKYLQTAKPTGWLEIDQFEGPAEPLDKFIRNASWRFRLKLPATILNGPDSSLLDNYSDSAPGVAVEPTDLAYVVFTSGSSGSPKGITGEHKALSHFVGWHERTFGLNKSDRFSMLSGLSHDPLLRDIFTPLSLGATLCIPDLEDIGTPGRLMRWMKAEQITVLHLTPAMGRLLTEPIAQGSPIDTAPVNINSLRYAFFSGDSLTQLDVKRLCALAPQVQCVNFYGTTETPQAVAYYNVTDQSVECPAKVPASLAKTLPLGRGIHGAQLLVLNHAEQLAGVGELGEIYVRSPYLARGYVEAKESTQALFITNPFTKVPGDRLYKTGDLGRYLPDGNVEFAGRTDQQVKIRGFRVEPAEIESVLASHAAVRQCVVAAKESGDQRRLVAYLTIKDGKGVAAPQLREHVGRRLPGYMVPTSFVFLDRLPLTPNSKVDYRALPTPDLESVDDYVAPRDPVEVQLTKIWSQLLGQKQVGIHDNFFNLGGHSLLAIRLFVEIERSFGRSLPLATIFSAPTIEQLAPLLGSAQEPADPSCIVVLQGKGSRPPLFCVAGYGAQFNFRRLAHHLGDDQPVYALQFPGLDGQREPLTSVEEIATEFLQHMRRVQPQGPYYLAGLCSRGLVAYEVAQQLIRQGQSVGLLVLLDTFVPGFGKRRKKRKDRRLVGENGFFGLTKQIYRVRGIISKAARRYRPEPYPGRLILVRPMKRSWEGADPLNGWGPLIEGGIETFSIEGHHRHLFRDPMIRTTARNISASLLAAQATEDQKVHGRLQHSANV